MSIAIPIFFSLYLAGILSFGFYVDEARDMAYRRSGVVGDVEGRR